MSNIDKNLLEDEQIIYRTKKHWIIFFAPIAWIAAAVFFACSGNPWVVKAALAPAFAALIIGIGKRLEYITAEFVITNKRVLMREGFFTRHSNELRLSTVSTMTINQSLLGQLLDYGTIVITPFGGGQDVFTEIVRPFEFQKRAQMGLDEVVK